MTHPIPAWANPTEPHPCRHCGYVAKASVWRFQICPKCGYRGGVVKHPAVMRGERDSGMGKAYTIKVERTRDDRPEPEAPAEPMTEGEKALVERAKELARNLKSGG